MDKKWVNLLVVVGVLLAIILVVSFFVRVEQLPSGQESAIFSSFASSGVPVETFDEALDSFDLGIEDQRLARLETELRKIIQTGSVQEKQSSQAILQALEFEKKQSALAVRLAAVEEEEISITCTKLEEINALPGFFLDIVLEADELNIMLSKASLSRISVDDRALLAETDTFDLELTRITDFCNIAANLMEQGEP